MFSPERRVILDFLSSLEKKDPHPSDMTANFEIARNATTSRTHYRNDTRPNEKALPEAASQPTA